MTCHDVVNLIQRGDMWTFKGTEVERDTNVLDKDVCSRISQCRHDVPAKDVP